MILTWFICPRSAQNITKERIIPRASIVFPRFIITTNSYLLQLDWKWSSGWLESWEEPTRKPSSVNMIKINRFSIAAFLKLKLGRQKTKVSLWRQLDHFYVHDVSNILLESTAWNRTLSLRKYSSVFWQIRHTIWFFLLLVYTCETLQ